MRRSGTKKFHHSVQLFKFCQKILADQKNTKIHDQEVGSILNFNPSDCSHWKKGEKKIKSVFSLAQLALSLNIEPTLLHDIASGHIIVDEAYFEHSEAIRHSNLVTRAHQELPANEINEIHQKVELFTEQLHQQANFTTPPLYLPEIFNFFPFLQLQPVDMIDKLSRILRIKPGLYTIQFKKADLKPQTRMSIIKDLARIIFEGERTKFPELEGLNSSHLDYEELVFIASLLIPKKSLRHEIMKIDSKKNLIQELSATFWAPKSLICFQLQHLLQSLEAFKEDTSYQQIEQTSAGMKEVGVVA